MSKTAYERIKASGELPSPSGVALRIHKLAEDENTTIEQISAVVELDPAIAGRVLKTVNSPLAGMSRQVVSTSHAVAMLGVRTVTSLALGLSLLQDHRCGRCKGFNYELFWSDAIARAVVARHISKHVKGFVPDEAFTCGLLSQIGRLAFACADPVRYEQAITTTKDQPPARLRSLERTFFGIDHNELSSEMMEEWLIPKIFCSAIRFQSSPSDGDIAPDSREHLFARILGFSESVARILTRPSVEREALSDVLLEAGQFGIAPGDYAEVFDAISEEWQQAGDILAVQTRHVPPLAALQVQAQQRYDAQHCADASAAPTTTRTRA